MITDEMFEKLGYKQEMSNEIKEYIQNNEFKLISIVTKEQLDSIKHEVGE